MDWIQVFTIIFTIIASLGGFLFWVVGRIGSDVKNLRDDLKTDIKEVKEDLKGWARHLTTMQAEQAKRTDKMNERSDKLYEMFYELLKESRK